MVPTHFPRAVPQLLPVATAHWRFEKPSKSPWLLTFRYQYSTNTSILWTCNYIRHLRKRLQERASCYQCLKTALKLLLMVCICADNLMQSHNSCPLCGTVSFQVDHHKFSLCFNTGQKYKQLFAEQSHSVSILTPTTLHIAQQSQMSTQTSPHDRAKREGKHSSYLLPFPAVITSIHWA